MQTFCRQSPFWIKENEHPLSRSVVIPMFLLLVKGKKAIKERWVSREVV